MNLKLEFPQDKHEKMYNNLIKVWNNNDSPRRLFCGNNFKEFLNKINSDLYNTPPSVPSHLFFLMLDKNIIGAIQIRHSINHPNLIESGGHIGYGIAPEYRKKGYGYKMLELGLMEAKKIGLGKLLITCDLDNIASEKIIIENGGKFERISEDGSKKRFWFEL